MDSRYPMAPKERFYSYSSYLRQKYDGRVFRVAVDAGFSCPNRGPDRSCPGCTYCDERGALAVYLPGKDEPFFDKESLKAQIERGIAFLSRRYKAGKYLLYFQAFSSTWAPAEKLRELYTFCLDLYPFAGLIVSSRPDCITERTVELLSSFQSDDFEVWIELGLQSVHDSTLKRINRGHSSADFFRAFGLIRDAGLKQTVHLIFGLPGEGWREIGETVRRVSQLRPEGIKIHNLHVPSGTAMAEEFLRGELTVPGDLRHLDYVVRALELLPADTVVLRVLCDTPRSRLIAPRGFIEKPHFYSALKEELSRRNTWQGRLFSAVS